MTAPKLTKAQREALEACREQPHYAFNGHFGVWKRLRIAGLIDQVSASADGGRTFRITDAGREALKGGAR